MQYRKKEIISAGLAGEMLGSGQEGGRTGTAGQRGGGTGGRQERMVRDWRDAEN